MLPSLGWYVHASGMLQAFVPSCAGPSCPGCRSGCTLTSERVVAVKLWASCTQRGRDKKPCASLAPWKICVACTMEKCVACAPWKRCVACAPWKGCVACAPWKMCVACTMEKCVTCAPWKRCVACAPWKGCVACAPWKRCVACTMEKVRRLHHGKGAGTCTAPGHGWHEYAGRHTCV